MRKIKNRFGIKTMEAFIIFCIIILFIFFKIAKQGKSKRFFYCKNMPRQDKVNRSIENMNNGKILSKRIMNGEESKIYYTLIKICKENYNINPQVSFKAFLQAESGTNAWHSFRDFYCDFLVTHKKGKDRNKPIAVIEYHGGGHYGDTPELKEIVRQNDFLKNEILNKVGIELFIIKESDIKVGTQYISDKMLEVFVLDLYSKVNSLLSQNLY